MGDSHLVSMIVADGREILTVTENGFGKRTPLDDYPVYKRGGQGVISIQTSERNGRCVGAVQVSDDDEVMLISNGGTLVRTRAGEISVQSRNTQGVTLIRLTKNELLVGMAQIESIDDDEDDLDELEDDVDGQQSENPIPESDEEGSADQPEQ
jgi:DNA gyrase subunit A